MNLSAFFLSCLFATTQLLAADQDTHNSWGGWVRQADLLHQQGKLPEAAGSAKRALELARAAGASDQQLPITHFLLASIYRDWGYCGESRANYARAVALWEKQPEVPAKYLFSAIVSLISEANECEDFSASEKLYRAHSVELERYRSGPLDQAKILAIQGGIARGRKRYTEAEDYFRRVIDILEHTPGSKPSDIAEMRNDVALMLSFQRRYQESWAESQRSIALFESIDPRFVTLPTALNNAAGALYQLGRKDESERMYGRALYLARELYGEDSRNTASIMMNYAIVLRKNKQLPAAEALQKQGMESHRRSLVHENQTVDVKELKK